MIHHSPKVNFYIEQSPFELHMEPDHPHLNDETAIFAKNAFISHITFIKFSCLLLVSTVQFHLHNPIVNDSWRLINSSQIHIRHISVLFRWKG